MIPTQEILTIHKTLIGTFGGSPGVRDLPALESALARPFQQYDGADLYESILQKAAALVESLLINHPFVDGNKRTGYTTLRLFLLQHRLDFNEQADRYRFIIDIASGQLKYDDILAWLTDNTNSAA